MLRISGYGIKTNIENYQIKWKIKEKNEIEKDNHEIRARARNVLMNLHILILVDDLLEVN